MQKNFRGNIYLPKGDTLDIAFDFKEDYFDDNPNAQVKLIIADTKRDKALYEIIGKVSPLFYDDTEKPECCNHFKPNYRISFYTPSSITKEFLQGFFHYKIVIDDVENDFQKTLYEGRLFQVGGIPYDNDY